MQFHKIARNVAVFSLLTLAFTKTVAAASDDPLISLPDGQVMINLSATERREVEQDLLVAGLSTSAIHADPQAVQNDINTVMHKAVDLAKKLPNVRTSTGSYQVYEITDSKTKEKKWRGSQTILLKSKEPQAILDLLGKLQELKMTMDGMNYQLDPKTAADRQDSLMEDALKQLQTRADRAAKALGKGSAILRDVSVQGAGLPYSVPMSSHYAQRLDSMAARPAPAPVAEAGDTVITLTVTARAILKP